MISRKEFKEFSYFYFEGDTLKIVEKCSGLPEDEDLAFCTLSNAISYVQKLGCAGISQHAIRSKYHYLCLTVLQWAVANIGEVFPYVFRGVRSSRPDSGYKILFGTRDLEIARFYGDEIKIYKNVVGLQTTSIVKSVKTNDWGSADDEIIFFPDP